MIKKEALAIVLALRNSFSTCLEDVFSLLMDHRPLTLLLGSKHGIPVLAASRLQRWAIQLFAYQTSMTNIGLPRIMPMLTHCLDGHERLWKNRMIGASKLMKLTAFKWNKLQSLSQICEAARGDPVLSHAMRCILYYYGSPAEKCIPDELKIYYNKQDEFTIEDGCILRGTRAVTPAKYQAAVLSELHLNHPGMV